MQLTLNDKEARIIGCLIEKQLATPDYYPLSLNALANACNQKTNREPVTSYDEDTVSMALESLIEKDLVNKSTVGRVPKFEELLTRKFNLVPRESSIISVLLLRGPQTIGEIRGRSARLYSFDSTDAVLEAVRNLESWEMIKRLPRQPGRKEARYAELLSDPHQPEQEAAQAGREQTAPTPEDNSRLDAMEEELARLRQEMELLRNELEMFKAQFE